MSLLILASCGAGQTGAGQPAAAGVGDEPPEVPVVEPVELDVIADVSAVAPGQVFTVAARLRVAAGWHIYWLNPGEAGRPTVGAFSVPDGFSVGPVRYPGPASFEGAGGLRLYGYANEVMLSVEVAAPDATVGDAVPIGVEASWLACSDRCIKGSARAAMTLAYASDARPSEPVDQGLFALHAARLVQPLGEACVVERWEAAAVMLFCGEATEAEFFPDAALQPSYAGQLSVAGDGGVRLRLGLRQPRPVTGVIRLNTSAGATFYAVTLEPSL
jgi:thiol:disulfide interchange protein DsbD